MHSLATAARRFLHRADFGLHSRIPSWLQQRRSAEVVQKDYLEWLFSPRREERFPNEFLQREYGPRYEFFRKALTALNFNGVPGDYAEFGCNAAMTFCIAHRLMAENPLQMGRFHLWAFDSFAGLPASADPEDRHPRWVAGDMSISEGEFHGRCGSRGVPAEAYTAVAGFYERSLDPAAPGPRPEKIRLAYVDCDMYSSTREVLRFLMPRLQHGMVIAFDDYYCWSPTGPSGERLAATEAFADHPTWRLLPYIQFGWHGMSFVVEGVREGTSAPPRNDVW